jgi:hypothetical protein
MLGLFVFDALNAVGPKLVNPSVRVGHDDRRVGGDDELRAALQEVVDEPEGGELARRAEGCLGLVEEVEPVAPEPVLQQGDERLAVRALVQADAAIDVQEAGILLYWVNSRSR